MTTPYSTGTVSVTAGSTVAKGIGTAWKTSGLVAGIFGLDSANGNPVPVLSVDSDTQITLAKPWRGQDASDQTYWITYDTTDDQQTVNLMEKVIEYLARLNKPALAALATLTPAADKLPYFGPGGAGALADFNAAARSLLAGGVLPNSQLPNSLKAYSAFVTDLNAILTGGWVAVGPETAGIPKPGYFAVITIPWSDNTSATQIAYPTLGEDVAYRRHRANGVWGPWRAAGASSVGQVYNANGMPSGAIIERGSNANGEYTRFADGTQICNYYVVMSGLDNKRLYRSWSFPAEFLNPPYITFGINLASFIAAGFPISNAGAMSYTSSIDLTKASATISLETAYAGVASGVGVVGVYCTAMGRWF